MNNINNENFNVLIAIPTRIRTRIYTNLMLVLFMLIMSVAAAIV